MQAKSKSIKKFEGETFYLSNFYFAETEYEGVVYKTSEHAFQAAKSLDPKDREWIRSCKYPSDAKRTGYEVQLRSDWEEIKLDVMRDCVRSKFSRNQVLRQKLLDTDDAELIEGNTWDDIYWGVCKKVGQNWLGKILMQIREELRNEKV